MRAKKPHNKKKKRVGRGNGSGSGKTSSRGQKGQMSRTGAGRRPGFEGGQNPIYRRLPKRGFNNAEFRCEFVSFNLERLVSLGESEVTPESLTARGWIKDMKDGLKVLGMGEVKKAITIKAHAFSKSAKDKIVKAGGKAILIEK